MAAFRAKYRIPNNVELQHCKLGEWLVINKAPKAVVIPMITFIEGEMEIPMAGVTRGDTPVEPIIAQPPTPTPIHTATVEATKKKRKRGKANEGSKEGEISQPMQQPPTKEPKTTRAHQKKSVASRTNKGTVRIYVIHVMNICQHFM